MFDIGKGRELAEDEYVSIFRIVFIMSLMGIILMTQSYAETVEQSLSSTITVGINTGSNTVNVTFEGSTNIFTISNSTNSYSVSYKRNVSCSDTSSNALNELSIACKSYISTLSSTCQKITEAYGDASSYYKPLLECTTYKTQCEKDKETFQKERDILKPFETNYNNCLNEKKNTEARFSTCDIEYNRLQNNSTSISRELKDVKGKSNMYGFGLLVAVIIGVGYYYREKKKQSEHPTEGVAPPR